MNEKTKPLDRNTKANNLFADDVNAQSTEFEWKTSLHHSTRNPRPPFPALSFPCPLFPFFEDL